MMNMRKIFFPILLFLLFCGAFQILTGQTVYEQVSSYSQAEKRITGIRNLAVSNLLDSEMEKLESQLSTNIIIQLSDNYKDTISVFSHSEKLLFWYWLGKTDLILQNYQFSPGMNQVYMPDDSLYHFVANYSLDNRNGVYNVLQSKKLPELKEDFLRLFFNYLIANTSITKITKEDIITDAEKYISTYPDATYNNYIKTNMLLSFKPSGFGIGFSLTGGYAASTRGLNENFGNFIPVGGEFNFRFSRIRLDLSFTGSIGSKLNASFKYNGEWEKSNRYTEAIGNGSAGVEIINKNTFVFYPFAGITTTTISSYARDEIQGEVNVKLSNFPGYHVGLSFEKRFTHQRNFSDYRERFIADYSSNYWCIRLKTGILFPGLQNEDEMFSGEMVFVKLSVGILSLPAVAGSR